MGVEYMMILLFAGLLAGIITGLVSASASAIMTPILTIVLKMDVYTALGISLATDVVASIVTTIIYGKHKCIELKKSALLVGVATVFTFIGSYISKDAGNIILGIASGIGICGLSMQFLKGNFNQRLKKFREQRFISILLSKPQVFIIAAGAVIGLNTGIMGAGGGVLILFTLMLGYGMEMKTAIGTSAFVMSVIALCGGMTHFYFEGFAVLDLMLTSIGGLIGAFLASYFVHNTNEQLVSKMAGCVFGSIGIAMVCNQLLV